MTGDDRGIFKTDYPVKILFTKTLRLKLADLPRWTPPAVIGEEREARR